jgi:lactate racemase
MHATESSSTIDFPWGRSATLPLAIPNEWAVEATWPDLSEPIDDYPGALRHALDHPEGGTPLDALVGHGRKVAIVVDDPSRWTPVRDVLPEVLRRLHDAGVTSEDISISAGVGRHHAVDDAAMRERVGDDVAKTYRCFSPPVDDLSQYVDLGTTPEGVPVRVFRPVAEADLRILIGSVLPHLQAGFGGGYKLIFPGCSHRSTLGALHRQGLGGDAGKLLGGDLDANPMRIAIRSAARLLRGPCFSISHLLGDVGQVFHVLSGDVEAVQRRLSAETARRFRVPPGPPADIVIAGNDPWPGDPMMSFKVLINHRAAAKPGGLLIGIFWTDPDAIAGSFPMGGLRAIAATGAVGGWIARHGLRAADRVSALLKSNSQFMIRWARELVVDRDVMVFSPLLREKLGPQLGPIRLFADQAEMWEAAKRVVRDIKHPTAQVYPRGGLTYVAS